MAWLAAAAVGTTFNLLCAGTMVSGLEKGGKLVDRKNEEHVMSFRVDLARKRWCDGEDCRSSVEIYSVSDTEIWFQKERGDIYIDSVVDRETGKLNYQMRMFGIGIDMQGTCRLAPFTGLPERKF